jgi:hypothetical protein
LPDWQPQRGVCKYTTSTVSNLMPKYHFFNCKVFIHIILGINKRECQQPFERNHLPLASLQRRDRLFLHLSFCLGKYWVFWYLCGEFCFYECTPNQGIFVEKISKSFIILKPFYFAFLSTLTNHHYHKTPWQYEEYCPRWRIPYTVQWRDE